MEMVLGTSELSPPTEALLKSVGRELAPCFLTLQIVGNLGLITALAGWGWVALALTFQKWRGISLMARFGHVFCKACPNMSKPIQRGEVFLPEGRRFTDHYRWRMVALFPVTDWS